MKNRMLHKSSGVALVTAIFLLVVLAGLAVAIVSLTTTQQTTSTQDEQGARAYLAAKAGLEWALFRQLQTGDLNCPRTATFAMPRNTTLSAFTVTVSCGAPSTGFGVASGEDPTAKRITITSVACNGPVGAACPAASNSPDYVQRVVRAQL
jgi:MSHA biogenesis protein MshP